MHNGSFFAELRRQVIDLRINYFCETTLKDISVLKSLLLFFNNFISSKSNTKKKLYFEVITHKKVNHYSHYLLHQRSIITRIKIILISIHSHLIVNIYLFDCTLKTDMEDNTNTITINLTR